MIDEVDRRTLWQSLSDKIGQPQADTLMTMLPAQPLPELVTREDMFGLRSENRTQFEAVHLRIDALTTKVDDNFATLDTKIDDRFTALDTKIDDRFATLDTKIDDRFTALDTKIDDRFTTLDTKIDDRFTALDTKIDGTARSLRAEVKADLATEIGQLRGDLVVWILATNAVTVAMFVAVLTLGLSGAFS